MSSRKTRSSENKEYFSLEDIKSLNTPEDRKVEITRILKYYGDDDRTKEKRHENDVLVLGGYDISDEAKVKEVWYALSNLVHPDKQSENKWKEKATNAQTRTLIPII